MSASGVVQVNGIGCVIRIPFSGREWGQLGSSLVVPLVVVGVETERVGQQSALGVEIESGQVVDVDVGVVRGDDRRVGSDGYGGGRQFLLRIVGKLGSVLGCSL